jgi:hypothetical protein
VYTGELDRRIRRPIKRPATNKLANTATAKEMMKGGGR